MLYKCKFWVKSIAFLGQVVTKDAIMAYLAKFTVIHDWVRPTLVSEMWSVIGLASYCYQFV